MTAELPNATAIPYRETGPERSPRSLARAVGVRPQGPRRCDDSGCQVLRMVRLQLSSRSEICKPVLLELLGADSYEERTAGRDINIAAQSLILNQTGALQKFWVHAWVV